MADILLIDDDDTVRSAMRRILERRGHRVRDAADGAEGIRLLGEAVPDLVVTDLIMPEKEGIETIQELRDAHPGLLILAVSGGGIVDPDGPLGDAELLGADASLAKPFAVGDFLAAVEGLLKR